MPMTFTSSHTALFDPLTFRQQFPALLDNEAGIYLDSTATMLKPYPVIDAINAYYRSNSATVHRSQHTTATMLKPYPVIDKCRTCAARLFKGLRCIG
ncbi:MAG: aminotransferase class V-fold PLP-dependent enzyme, partial [Plesiomonas sp.]